MAQDRPAARSSVAGRGARPARIADILRKETVGGALLLLGTLVGDGLGELARPVTPTRRCATTQIGPEALHLHLSLGTWAADGLLAIFFFVVGLELKREFVAGDLRDPRRAALPILAAVGGMAAPALVYVLVNLGTGGGALRGWAIPTATDIAFAVAILAVISTHLPTALRTFLLTLAVVDDLLAITIIALFYTSDLDVPDAAAGPGAAGALRRGGPATDPVLVAPAAAGRGDLDAGARFRGARHRGRRPARLHGAGAAQPRRRRTGGGPGPGRALRAPDPPGLGRLRGPGVRVLRRRGRDRRLVRAGRLAQRPGRDRDRRGPGGRQDRGRSTAPRSCCPS